MHLSFDLLHRALVLVSLTLHDVANPNLQLAFELLLLLAQFILQLLISLQHLHLLFPLAKELLLQCLHVLLSLPDQAFSLVQLASLVHLVLEQPSHAVAVFLDFCDLGLQALVFEPQLVNLCFLLPYFHLQLVQPSSVSLQLFLPPEFVFALGFPHSRHCLIDALRLFCCELGRGFSLNQLLILELQGIAQLFKVTCLGLKLLCLVGNLLDVAYLCLPQICILLRHLEGLSPQLLDHVVFRCALVLE